MSRQISLADDDLLWLRSSHKSHTYTGMAKRIGCCVDTLKRILVREGLQEFEGAKYQVRIKQKMWMRPCVRCNSEQVRPKNHYFCKPCRRTMGYID
jgi:hypothetical protein